MARKLLLGFLFGILLLVIHFHGIFYPDEGYMLHSASRILAGEVLYKDFQFVYTPLTPLLLVPFFALFGESVVVARLVALLLTTITCIVLFQIAGRFTKGVGTKLLVVFLYLSWGPLHVNFLWPLIVAVDLSVLSLWLYLLGERNRYFFFFSGIVVVLALLAKQNIGIFLLGAYGVHVLFGTQKRRNVLVFGKGVIAGILAFVVALLATGTMQAFVQNMQFNVVQKILIEQTIVTPIIYGSSLYAFAKLVFYTSPLFFAIVSLRFCYKEKREYAIVPLIVCAVFLAGFRPVTDYIHLSPLVALLGLSMVLLLSQSKQMRLRLMLWVFACTVIALGMYIPLFQNYYRWQEPMTKQTNFVADPRVGIFVDKKYARQIRQLIDYVSATTEPGDQIFINYYAPMVYFLANRHNATPYDYISVNAITKENQLAVISILSEKQVPLVITHSLGQVDSPLQAFIAATYQKQHTIDDLTFWALPNHE